ncbi:diacylglycerol/lipid kinase family protein [Anaerococcus hydrogenalis]|uniref:Lipid kinase n=1 Tax=Anaerococcus hydrogenalis TaxID=33029 RepID=A0A2N6UKS8_9FIRM|nr:diacylglycerol kinase family protein [Anaerococcus hydrogenalis]MDK7694406.1 diacylglycerol kinase family lipid kinase [Anaerococcus hydrogenalis]MDK7696184.1 diacylglycerol kinase family lipid kinase [Anaerococcus hydrogenalis]MDK7707433.1 diacylglycerol kinase family lipid kinase [Anaerococcus hydrogenalis]PMC82448.1 lipid kinase [Anaerococcus hydrogenalis]
MKKCMIIENPNSGDGKNDEYMEVLIGKLENEFDQVVHKKTKKEGDGENFSKNACLEKYDSIFVVGGDGSFNEVINGISKMDYRPKVGLLPGGTNNTYMQLIGGSNDLKEAIDNLSLEKTKKVDIGKCNDKYFSYYVCFGKLIEATTSTDSSEKEKLGGLAYVKNILKTIPSDETSKIQISYDDKTFESNASLVYVMTVNKVGNLEFSKDDGDLSDGELNVFIMTEEGLMSKVNAAKDMLFGKVDENENVKSFTCKKLSIKNLENKEIELDMDGEVNGKLPCDIEILEKHVEIYLPKSGN